MKRLYLPLTGDAPQPCVLHGVDSAALASSRPDVAAPKQYYKQTNKKNKKKQKRNVFTQSRPGRKELPGDKSWAQAERLTDSSCTRRRVASAGFTLLAFACLQLA